MASVDRMAVAQLLAEQLFGVMMQRQTARNQFLVLRLPASYAIDFWRNSMPSHPLMTQRIGRTGTSAPRTI